MNFFKGRFWLIFLMAVFCVDLLPCFFVFCVVLTPWSHIDVKVIFSANLSRLLILTTKPSQKVLFYLQNICQHPACPGLSLGAHIPSVNRTIGIFAGKQSWTREAERGRGFSTRGQGKYMVLDQGSRPVQWKLPQAKMLPHDADCDIIINIFISHVSLQKWIKVLFYTEFQIIYN